MIRIEVKDREVQQALRQLASRCSRPAGAMRGIGELVAERTKATSLGIRQGARQGLEAHGALPHALFKPRPFRAFFRELSRRWSP